MNEINLGGNYQLKINSKKLKSGKCQVKFKATVDPKHNMYGYVLADSGEKLGAVVKKIVSKLDQVKNRDSFHHINLYRIGQSNQSESNFMIFDA